MIVQKRKMVLSNEDRLDIVKEAIDEMKKTMKEAMYEVMAEEDEKDKHKGSLPIGDWAVCKQCQEPIVSEQTFAVHHSKCLEDCLLETVKAAVEATRPICKQCDKQVMPPDTLKAFHTECYNQVWQDIRNRNEQ